MLNTQPFRRPADGAISGDSKKYSQIVPLHRETPVMCKFAFPKSIFGELTEVWTSYILDTTKDHKLGERHDQRAKSV